MVKTSRGDQPPTWIGLRDSLVRLYPTRSSAERVADAAGIPKGFVDWEGTPIDQWHAVLTEASKRGLVEAIVDIARREYPNDAPLRGCDPLEVLYSLRDTRRIEDKETTDVDEEIRRIRRERREGPQLKPGEYLGHRYRLIEALGHGGFATVWKAYDRVCDGFVAIKVLHGQWVGDASRLERFKRGARTMARLKHPNVVRILAECSEDHGFHYFVMEYVDGGDLRRAVLARMSCLTG